MTKKKLGRPTDYTDALADEICERVASGSSIRKICAEEGGPTMSAVFRWLNEHSYFQEQYVRAKEEQAELYADEIVQIADETNDPAKARLQIDARKWTAMKLKPKKYGERHTHEHSGPDGGPIKSETGLSENDRDILERFAANLKLGENNE